ncbi:mesoderm posterior aa [Salarias fasciatus]|uniref:mesoderm posterior aa n=1 Tax=Salarias fasciatus TaxID=181472 RepID=UPI001176D136|nr:uncharacterized protein LOC115390209 [Salarias fasciatus]
MWIVYDEPASCHVTPRPGVCLFPMGPPGRGVIPAPRASQDEKWLPEVQLGTFHNIYGEESLPCLTHVCLPQQRHTDSSTHTAAAAAMEASHCSSLQLPENNFLLDCESLLDRARGPDPALDPGYFSAGSSLSPTSSVDSFCLSPTCLQPVGIEHTPLESFVFSSLPAPSLIPQTQNPLLSKSSSASSSTTKVSRSRYPGKKRQNASEREKLRMRDLTKALNHLRTYLPPSVAPTGQSLTKIETLRHTIRYISYLSAQLGLTEEALELRRSTGFMEQSQSSGQPSSSSEQQSALQHSHQVSSGLCFSSEQHWMQQIQSVAFSGLS